MAKNRNQAAAAGAADKGLKVVSKRASFWRAGIQFTSEPRVLPLSELTVEQAERIRAEGEPGGQLVVTEVDIEPAKV